ncbi:MAG: cell division protein FtsA [Spirochaetaceae bacterium]|nr:cell division protein FtsA [Spirochaetaceae bacterium]
MDNSFIRRHILANGYLIVGLDIGTTRVRVVIGERTENGRLEITGVAEFSSTGLRKGTVVNIEATLRSIVAAIEAAEMMSGREVHSVWIGIGGSHIDGLNSRGVVAVTGKNWETREISAEDILRVLKAARAVAIPMDRQVLELIPQNYTVDGQRGIRNPLDMMGVRLEAEVHLITCSVTGAQNLVKCVNRAGFRVDGLILQSLAAGRAVLTEEEKEQGTALIDMGGGTTDMLVYSEGTPYSTTTIPAGGTQVTSDISIIRNISLEAAEKIKLEAGSCWEGAHAGEDDIIVPGVGGRPPQSIPRLEIEKIIRPRLEEFFFMVKENLDKLTLSRPLGGGVVLTGGASQLLGAAELASDIFQLPVRLGSPLPVGGLVEEYRNPAYATAVGLVLEGNDRSIMEGQERGGNRRTDRGNSSAIGRFIDWVRREFF